MQGLRLKGFRKIVSQELIAIELEKNRLKIAQATFSLQGEEIVNLIQRDITGLDDSEVANLLLGLMEISSKKQQRIIDIITPSAVITKNIEVPSTDPVEIKEIVSLQAGRHTPYAREEIIVDFLNLGIYRKNYTRILLVILNRNIIRRHFEIFSKAGIVPEGIVFSAEAVALNTMRLWKISTEEAPCGVIHMDEDSTDFMVIFKSKPIFIRQISIGAKQLSFEKEKFYLRFLEEIKRSQEAYLAEDVGKMPSRFVLTGGIEAVADLEKSMDIACERLSYLSNLSVSAEVLKDTSLNKNISFLNMVSALLSFGRTKIDLIPEEVKLKKILQIRAKELLKSAVLVMVFFVLLFLILLNKIYFKSLYLKELDKKYRVLMEEARHLEEDFSRLSLVRNYLTKRGYSLEVLAEIYNVLPQELEISDIRYEEQGKFSLRGNANSMSLVFSLVDSLEKSPYFKEVKTRYTTKRKSTAGRDITDFEIVCNLERTP